MLSRAAWRCRTSLKFGTASAPLKAQNFKFPRYHLSRSFSDSSSKTQWLRWSRRDTIVYIGGGFVAGAGWKLCSVFSPLGTAYADAPESERAPQTTTPLSSVFRTYLVYSICSVPTLVDWSPAILATLTSIPGIKQITEAAVRQTFFAQFVGGDTAEDLVPIIRKLRSEKKGVLLAYSVEVDEEEAAGKSKVSSTSKGGNAVQPMHKRIVDEMVHSIDVAADLEDSFQGSMKTMTGRKTWVAVKVTALVPNAHSLINFSSHLIKTRAPTATPIAFPGCPQATDLDVLYSAKNLPKDSPLTGEDIVALKELDDDLKRICLHAQERGVRVIIDAEYSWYQPAIDAYTLSLMRAYNKLPAPRSAISQFLNSLFFGAWPHRANSDVQPLVYGTFQAYLRRTPEYLVQSLRDAAAGNFALGVKLVRGAYHPHEIAAHPSSPPALEASALKEGGLTRSQAQEGASLSISPEAVPPVWLSKDQTDNCYNGCARMLVECVQRNRSGAAKGGVPYLGILFGTHNWNSCDVILDELVRTGLAAKENDKVVVDDDVAEQITIGQIYGMADALTTSAVDRTKASVPFVIKYLPYGALAEVMPYLSRRAIENKSVLGGGAAVTERKRAGAELRRRVLGL